MKVFFKIVCILIFVALDIFFLRHDPFFKREHEVHFFYEPYATMPALLEAIEFVKLPQEKQKIFAWHRFTDREKKIDLNKYSATELKIPAAEGFYYPAKVHQYILDLARKNSNATFILYTNLAHIKTLLIPLLQKLPKNRVKHIHLYEDGLCGVVSASILRNESIDEIPIQNIMNLKKVLEDPKNYSNYKISYRDIFAISKIYPTTYHLGCENLFNQRFNSLKKQIQVDFVDFRKIRYTLKPSQKELLWKLLDFDYNKYKKLLFHKKSLFLLGGFFFDNKNSRLIFHQFADALQNGVLMRIPNDLVWLYKPHPSFSAKGDMEYMRDLEKKWEFIPPQIPVEVFILAELEPTYVAGYPSSANFSFYNEQTALLFKRSNYQKILENLGIEPKKFISVKEIQKAQTENIF